MPSPILSKAQAVKVAVRCRPLNNYEKSTLKKSIVIVQEENYKITVENPYPQINNQPQMKDFAFDTIFNQNSTQQSLFQQIALPIIESVLLGYNGTIFAYGQTGAGKTFTMEGVDDFAECKGIVPRTFIHIFQAISNAVKTKKYLIKTSFLQLYNEQFIDLFAEQWRTDHNVKKKLKIIEKPYESIKVDGIVEFMIENQQEILHKYKAGKDYRALKQTHMSRCTTKSHSIFTIIIENQQEVNGKIQYKIGKLNLVDLAGSERQNKKEMIEIERYQSININLSLSTLTLVIKSLVNPKSKYIPYCDSQLTRLLRDSLGGNTKTAIIACIGPAENNYQQTLSTLKFASRAKMITNDLSINYDPKDGILRQLQEEIQILKDQAAKNMIRDERYIFEYVTEEQKNDDIEGKLKLKTDIIKKTYQAQQAEIYKTTLEETLKTDEKMKKQNIVFLENQQNLIKKLKQMEKKILAGNQEKKTTYKKTEETNKKLQKFIEQKQSKHKIEKALKKQQNSFGNINKIYINLQQQSKDNSLKIQQKLQLLNNLQNQNRQLQEQYKIQIEQLQDRRRMLHKILKLNKFIIDYFIPTKYIEQIYDKAIFNQTNYEWLIPYLEFAGNSSKIRNQQVNFVEQQENGETKINQLVKNQLKNYPNVYFAYSDDGIVRQTQLNNTKRNSIEKNPQSNQK